MWKKLSIREVPRHARNKRPFVVALNSCARIFDELPVLHSGRTSSLAGAAIQAFIDVLDKSCIHPLIALFHPDHLKYASTRRIRFKMPQPVGRTMVQAQPAMHAARIVFVARMQIGCCARFGQDVKFLPRNGRWRTCHQDRTNSSRGARYPEHQPSDSRQTTAPSTAAGRITQRHSSPSVSARFRCFCKETRFVSMPLRFRRQAKPQRKRSKRCEPAPHKKFVMNSQNYSALSEVPAHCRGESPTAGPPHALPL